MSQKGYEIGTLIGTIDPQNIDAVEVFTDTIDMTNFDQVTFYFLIGDAADDDIIARVVTCNSSGNSVAAFKTADTLGSSPSSNDNSQIIINVAAEDLAGGTSPADRYVKGGIVSASASLPVACAVIGYLAKHAPGHADVPDLTSVKEIEDDLD